MKTLTVFDPAMCCSTGVCGSDVDQVLVDFSADVQWLKGRGVQIGVVSENGKNRTLRPVWLAG